jgi:spermidine synthase
VHPAMQGSLKNKSILILGGGDGIAMREVLKYPELEKVTLVDLDPKMTSLFKSHPAMLEINKHSLENKKAIIINDDAFAWLRKNNNIYDCIIVDFPDPSTFAIAKLYTNSFYTELAKHISDDGFCVVQCTSPYAAKKSFWTIDNTIRSVGFNTIPYYNMVPSFGMWGYILCTKQNEYTVKRELPSALKFYTEKEFAVMRQFPNDMTATGKLEVNKLNNQVLVSIFEEEWNKYLQ